MPWWNANYASALQTVIPPSAGGHASGAVARVRWDTHVPISHGEMRRDRRDLRMVYDDGATATEIDRILTSTGEIVFRLQASIPAGTISGDYWIYYGYPAESSDALARPRVVWPAYLDGSDSASLTTTGTVTYPSRPRPGFIKNSNNPIVRRTSGTGWKYNARDADGLFYNSADGYWLLWFDAADRGEVDGYFGWQVYLVRSNDLVNWESMGPQISGTAGPTVQNGSGGPDFVATSLIVHKFDGDPLYYATYLGSTAMGDGVSLPTYRVMGAYASSPYGPWTKAGVLVDISANGEDDYYVGDAQIVTFDGGTTYEIFYGRSGETNGAGRAVSTTGPLGPYTKTGSVVDAPIENPHVIYDASRSQYYLLTNYLVGAYSNTLFWSASRTAFNAASQVEIIGQDYGAWDEYWIGLPSVPVVRDGMVYVAYDGGTLRGKLTSPTHYGHDVGIAEARWPLEWGDGISSSAGATVTTPAVLTGDGVFTVRRTFSAAGEVRLTGGGHYYALGTTGSPFLEYVEIDGVRSSITSVVSGLDGYSGTHSPATTPSKAVRFIRSGSTMRIVSAGVEVWSGACVTDPLSASLRDSVIAEEMFTSPLSYVEALSEPLSPEALPSGVPIPMVPTAPAHTGIVGAGQLRKATGQFYQLNSYSGSAGWKHAPLMVSDGTQWK